MELLTVIFIIGLLSTIAVVGLQSSREKARDDERVADLAMMGIALEQYYNACGRQYPQPDGSHALTLGANEGCTGITLQTFLKTLPKDPKDNTTNYVYAVNDTTKATDYVLRATFETAHRKLTDDTYTTVFAGVAGQETDCADTPDIKFYCVKP